MPSIFGFDPRFQFVHEDDVVRSILFVLDHDVPGIYNVAGDGLLPWSEVAALCGKRTMPFRRTAPGSLPDRCARSACGATRGVLGLLNYGRGIDNGRLKDTGFRYNTPLRKRSTPSSSPFASDALSAPSTVLPLRTRRRAVLPPLPRGGAGAKPQPDVTPQPEGGS